MTASGLLRIFLLAFVSIVWPVTLSSQILLLNYTASTNSLLPVITQQEIHLARSLFVETNKGFDEKVCRSLGAAIKPPAIISFHLVSFVFSYPSTNDWTPSHCEMGQPDELLCNGGNVSRRSGATNEIPLNYVRIVDRQKKEITADLNLLLGEAPLNDPKNMQYFRRSFRFVYRDGWKEE